MNAEPVPTTMPPTIGLAPPDSARRLADDRAAERTH
jgi:hypothetical protein